MSCSTGQGFAYVAFAIDVPVRHGFKDEPAGAPGLYPGALAPTFVNALFYLI